MENDLCWFKHRAQRGSLGNSVQIPNTKEVVSLCFHCNEHHASTRLRAAGDSSSCKFSFNFTFPQTFCHTKVDCHFLSCWSFGSECWAYRQNICWRLFRRDVDLKNAALQWGEPMVIFSFDLDGVLMEVWKVGISIKSSTLQVLLTVLIEKWSVSFSLTDWTELGGSALWFWIEGNGIYERVTTKRPTQMKRKSQKCPLHYCAVFLSQILYIERNTCLLTLLICFLTDRQMRSLTLSFLH